MIRRSKPAIEEPQIVRRRNVLSDSEVAELSEIRTEEITQIELNEKRFLPNASTRGRFEPFMIEEIRKLARFGHTNEEIAEFYGVCLATWYGWMRRYPELQTALYQGREEDGHKIVESLHKQALGYEVEEVQREYYIDKEGTRKLKIERRVKKQVLPSSKAGIYLLKTRFPNKWTETIRTENRSTIDVNVSKKLDLSDLTIEELMLMKKIGMRSVPEAFHSQRDKLKTIQVQAVEDKSEQEEVA